MTMTDASQPPGPLDQLLSTLTDIAASSDRSAAAERLAAVVQDLGVDDIHLQEVEAGRYNVIARTGGAAQRLLVSDLDALHSDGVGATTAALIALHAHAGTNDGITFAATVGGRNGGTGIRFLLDAAGFEPPAQAVVCSPTELAVHDAEAGLTQLVITLEGRAVWAGQTSLLPWVNAIDKALHAVARLDETTFNRTGEAAYADLPRLTVTAMRGGLTKEFNTWRPAVVADHAAFLCDLSHPPGVAGDDLVNQVREELDSMAAIDENFRYALVTPPATRREPWQGLDRAIPPLDRVNAADAAADLARAHEVEVGKVPRITVRPGRPSGLAGHLAAAGVSCVGYGPGSSTRPGSFEASRIQMAGDVLARWCGAAPV